jgi:predicted TIM-barrel fold metal-dependent hydrolase
MVWQPQSSSSLLEFRWPSELLLDLIRRVPLLLITVNYRLERIMYGSDFPDIPYSWDREPKLLSESGLSHDDLEWILNKNACNFFNLNL